MSEKTTIGIAVVAFFVISVISPLHIVIWGAVIIIALTCARETRGKKVQKLLNEEKTKFVRKETLLLDKNEQPL